VSKKNLGYFTQSNFLVFILILVLSSDNWAESADSVSKAQSIATDGKSILIDMDGDGRKDEFRIDSIDDNLWRMTAKLANGSIVSDSLAEGPPTILGAADIAGDHRHEVLVHTGGETWSLGIIVTLYHKHLFVFPNGSSMNTIGWGAHSMCCPGATEDVACIKISGKPFLVLVSSEFMPRKWKSKEPPTIEQMMSTPDSQLDRHWNRSIYRLKGGKFFLNRKDSGILPATSKPPRALPLDNGMKCGTANN